MKSLRKTNAARSWVMALGVLFLLLVLPSLPRNSGEAASSATFTIRYDPKPHVYLFPLENELDRNVTVENNGSSSLTLQFNGTIYGPNGFVEDAGMLGIGPLPQPSNLYLQAGDSNKIYIVAGTGSDLDSNFWQSGTNYTYTIELSVYPVDNPSLKQTVNLTNIADVLTTAFPSSAAGYGIPPNASVSGRVLAADTGLPVSGANVAVSTVGIVLHSSTDSSGNYNVPLIAYRRVEQGNYLNYNVQITTAGYQSFNKIVTPTGGQNIVLNAVLQRANQTASFSVFAQFDTHMNNDRGAGSADGSIFAVVPFHTLDANSDYIYQNAYIWTFSSNGTLLWRYRLYSETPAVDVSANGLMVATTVTVTHQLVGGQVPQPLAPGIYLFNAKGNVIWTYTSNQYLQNDSVYEVRFSHNGRYLAAGDAFGNAIMIDLSTKTVVWHSFLGGQVRYISFDQNDSAAYFSSGDGYLYALSTQTGHQLWRTYVGAWALSMGLSKDNLMVSGKNGYYLYLLNDAGKTLWTVPAYHAGFDLVFSPDESYIVYYGNAAGTVTTVLASNGTREFTLDGSNGGAISGDGRYFTETGIQGLSQNVGVAYVSLFTSGGDQLWTASLNDSGQHAAGAGYQWMSPDKTEIIATTGEYVYFLRGSITDISASTSSTTGSSAASSSGGSTASTTTAAGVGSSTRSTTAAGLSSGSSSTTSNAGPPDYGPYVLVAVVVVVVVVVAAFFLRRKT